MLREYGSSLCREAIAVSEPALAQRGFLVAGDGVVPAACGEHGKTGKAVAAERTVLKAH